MQIVDVKFNDDCFCSRKLVQNYIFTSMVVWNYKGTKG
jgi:hypothetical protein